MLLKVLIGPNYARAKGMETKRIACRDAPLLPMFERFNRFLNLISIWMSVCQIRNDLRCATEQQHRDRAFWYVMKAG